MQNYSQFNELISELQVDGVEVDQSYSSEDGLVEVSFYRPRTLILEVKACNYIVTYDGRSRASIIAPKEYGENLSGMCGNCKYCTKNTN